MRKRCRTSVEHAVKAEVADGLNHSGEDKSESEDQGGAIMSAAKAHKGICGIAKAEESAANFKVKIGLRSSGVVCAAEVENRPKVDKQEGGDGRNESGGRPLPENPDEFGPISHKLPQLPMKTGQTRRNARQCPFTAENLML
jgi:hypothetical protein